ncbi:MAG: hypothetical protein AAF490_23970, partial [Chloroflexota bacterium]
MNLRQQIENNQKVLLFAIIGLLLLFGLWGQRPFTANGSTVESVNQDEPSVNNQNANEPTAQENQILEDIPVLNDT